MPSMWYLFALAAAESSWQPSALRPHAAAGAPRAQAPLPPLWHTGPQRAGPLFAGAPELERADATGGHPSYGAVHAYERADYGAGAPVPVQPQDMPRQSPPAYFVDGGATGAPVRPQ